ncbi:hypothetical protein RT41_GL001301 [Lactococcus fujiensis JCM 16395]|uniref:Uncharacterized protein n=1 Tax=Lactococcus fujiensis JCM 16395 TaxID=1291764 RepID=A0A2A5RM77_9LACT|nr:hypothetical protein RT41_GL001301 [Lactococcus fujiensis JCM 16395]
MFISKSLLLFITEGEQSLEQLKMMKSSKNSEISQQDKQMEPNCFFNVRQSK